MLPADSSGLWLLFVMASERQLGPAGLGWTLLPDVYSTVVIWELTCCFQF